MCQLLGKWTSLTFILVVFFSLFACGKAEISDVEHVQKASQYQAEGNFQATLIELKNALQKNPQNSEARLLLGELYVFLGDGVAAEKELARAQNLGVSGPFVQELVGESLLLQHRYNDILEAQKKWDWKSQPELLVLRGQAQLGLGQYQEAEASFRQALELKADTIPALLWLSRVLLASNDSQGARETLERALSVDPENVEAWVLKGRVASAQERMDDAQTDFRRAIDLVTLKTPRRIEMEARTELARLLIAQRQFDDAAVQVEFLLKASPRHPITNYMAALLAYEQKQYTKARDYLQVVLSALPDHMKSIFLLGSTNYALGNLEQAEVQLARVVTAVPTLLPARMMLAGIRLQQAQSDQALDVLKPALDREPNNVRLLAMAGQAALRSGELEKGKEYLQKAIQKQPNEGGLRAQLAMLYLAEGDDAQAIKELEQAIKTGDASPDDQALLALTLLRQKDFDAALSIAKRLVVDNPDNAYMQNLLGIIYASKGEVGLARTAFNDAIRIDASFIPSTLNLVRLDIQAGRQSDARDRLDAILVRDENNVSAMMILAQLADLDGNRAEALEWLEKARVADTRALAPRMVLVRLYLRAGDLARARDVVRETLAIEPSNARVLLAAGQVELAAQDYTAAVKRFEKLSASTPVAEAYFWLGLAHVRAGEEAKAKQALDKALSLDSAHLGAAELYLLLDLRANKVAQALNRARNIVRQHPNSLVGYEREGDVQVMRGVYVEAINLYRKARLLGGGTRVLLKEVEALRQSQGDRAANKLLESWFEQHKADPKAGYSLALAYVAAGNQPAAIKQYQHLLKVAPKNVAALNDIAWLLYQEKRPTEALKYAKRAYDLEPESGVVLDTYGWIVLGVGDASSALKLLRQASEKQPNAKEVQYHYAFALVKTGKRDSEAKEILEKMLAGKQEFRVRREAQKLLDSLAK